MKIHYLLVFVALQAADGQTPQPQFTFLPPGLHFAPLRANVQEPRLGVFKFLNASDMKVDIGNSIDLFEYLLPSENLRITAGIDFMAYALTTGSQGLRLQIDAVDGFFGGNLSVSKSLGGPLGQARLRILHHSAHLDDGHYATSSNTWLDNRAPFPYTQDFGELVLAYSAGAQSRCTERTYAGISYATLARPSDLQRFSFLGGFEAARMVSESFLNQRAYLYAAYNVTLTGTPAYAASHQIQLGWKFGDYYGKGPSVYVAYYTGRKMFGEYFDEMVTTLGAGFTVDFL